MLLWMFGSLSSVTIMSAQIDHKAKGIPASLVEVPKSVSFILRLSSGGAIISRTHRKHSIIPCPCLGSTGVNSWPCRYRPHWSGSTDRWKSHRAWLNICRDWPSSARNVAKSWGAISFSARGNNGWGVYGGGRELLHLICADWGEGLSTEKWRVMSKNWNTFCCGLLVKNVEFDRWEYFVLTTGF